MPTDVTQAPNTLTPTGNTSKFTGSYSATATLASATTNGQQAIAGYNASLGLTATGTLSFNVPFLTLGSGEVCDSLQLVVDTGVSNVVGTGGTNNITFNAKQGGTTYYTRTVNDLSAPNYAWTTTTFMPGLSGTGWASAATAEFVAAANRGTNLEEVSFKWRKYAKPTISSLAPSGTVSLTSRPTISWTFTGDGLTQNRFRVKIFSAAQYGIGGFDPETSPNTADSGEQVSAATSWTCNVDLTNGTTYRAYVKCAQLTPTSSIVHWTTAGSTWLALGASAYVGFTVSLASPGAPTAHTPAASATVNTSAPSLTANIPAHTITNITQTAEWQFATDAGFTSNVRTVLGTTFNASGTASLVSMNMIDTVTRLFQGTWYVRARVKDSNGLYGSYDAGTSFTVSHAPSASTFGPTGQASRAFGGSGATTFSWVFSDPYSLDVQTAFQVLVERDSDALSIHDSGKQTSGLGSYTTNISSTYKDTLLRWRVRLYDMDDVVGSYSANQQFYVRDAPTVSVTAPVTTTNSPGPTVTWTFTASAGRTQTAYRVVTVVTAGGALVHDSGYVSGSALSYAHPAVLTNGTGYTTTVTVRDSSNLENSASSAYTASWTPATSPTVTISATNYDTLGYVRLTWPENRDANFVAYNVYRRVTGTTDWTRVGRLTSTSSSTYTFDDYYAEAGSVDYAVTQEALRFGVPVDGTKSPATTATSGTHYWLMSVDDTSLSVQLASVKGDSYTDEWEQGEILLLGRGRRVERGTRYGYRGSLSAQVYDQGLVTARQVKLSLEAARAAGVRMRLRTPFGDVWDVALGDMQISRIAGVGLNEYFTVDIPYIEVAALSDPTVTVT